MTQQYTLQSEVPPQLPPQEPIPNREPFSQKKLPLLAGGALILLLIAFFSGFLLRGLFIPQPQPNPSPSSSNPSPLPTPQLGSPTPSEFSEIPASSIQFLPGKQYFEDTYALISKDQPYYTVLLTIARIEQERNYAQYTKINYFDGTNWQRKAVTTTITNSNITTNTLLREWNPSLTTQNREENMATILIENQEVAFTSTDLTNEISVESLPGSTKFIYQGEGSITVDNESHEVYILHTRSYSFNAIDLAFFNSPQNLNSNFVSFWDEEGDFYYVDTHSTKNPTSPVQTREVGIKEDVRGIVSKTERIIPSFQQKNGVNEFTLRLDQPIGEQLQLIFFRPLNKAENNSYTWTLSNATGTSVKAEGRTVKGIGIVEYIRPQE